MVYDAGKDKLDLLATLHEDEVQYQSSGNYHKERFRHLQMLAEHWTFQEALNQKKNAKKEGRVPVYTDVQQKMLKESTDAKTYVGSLELCAPAPRSGNAPELEPQPVGSS
eukprot:COSAG06_NODE_5111_length_3712_cov_3.101024_2_plen_110_part_00